jgi:hypothetical protein
MPDIDPKLIPSGMRMWGLFKAKCDTPDCGWEKQFAFSNGMGLQVGDPLPSGGEMDFDTCMKCKRKSLKISHVPDKPRPPGPTGFWKVPTE